MQILMSAKSYQHMNMLLNKYFEANSIIDNLAYNLNYMNYNNIADIVHHKVAHLMPVIADEVSDEMLLLGGRPTRGGLAANTTEYKDVKEIFQVLFNVLNEMRVYIKEYIEAADMDGDDEVRIFLEHLLKHHIKLIKQADEWLSVLSRIDANDVDNNIDDYTHFLAQ